MTDLDRLAASLRSDRLTRTALADGTGVILDVDGMHVLTLNADRPVHRGAAVRGRRAARRPRRGPRRRVRGRRADRARRRHRIRRRAGPLRPAGPRIIPQRGTPHGPRSPRAAALRPGLLPRPDRHGSRSLQTHISLHLPDRHPRLQGQEARQLRLPRLHHARAAPDDVRARGGAQRAAVPGHLPRRRRDPRRRRHALHRRGRRDRRGGGQDGPPAEGAHAARGARPRRGRHRRCSGHRQDAGRLPPRAYTSPEIQAIKDLDGVRFNCEENFQQTERYVETLVSDETFDYVRTSTDLFLAAGGPVHPPRRIRPRRGRPRRPPPRLDLPHRPDDHLRLHRVQRALPRTSTPRRRWRSSPWTSSSPVTPSWRPPSSTPT